MTRRHALTSDQVRELRALHKPGVRGAGYRELARRLGLAESTVRDALTGRTAYVAAVHGFTELTTIAGPDHTTVREIRPKMQQTVKYRSEA